jgi:hypothetical protein
MMKNRLLAYGRIQKGRPERCLMVVFNARRRPAGQDSDCVCFEGCWRNVFRFFGGALSRR